MKQIEYDKSYGVIAFDCDKVLIIKRGLISSWDLPKGHQNPNESTIDAACRELQEETGYSKVTVFPHKIVHIYYEFDKDDKTVYKEVFFFVGEKFSDEIPTPNPDDSDMERDIKSEWVDYNEALKRVTFPSMNAALRHARQIFDSDVYKDQHARWSGRAKKDN